MYPESERNQLNNFWKKSKQMDKDINVFEMIIYCRVGERIVLS